MVSKWQRLSSITASSLHCMFSVNPHLQHLRHLGLKKFSTSAYRFILLMCKLRLGKVKWSYVNLILQAIVEPTCGGWDPPKYGWHERTNSQ